MKKLTLIAVVAVASMLLFAGFAMAAPGDYDPHTTSTAYENQLTDQYTDSAGNTYAPGYDFLNPGNNNVDPRTTVGEWDIFNANWTGELDVPYYKTNAGDPDFHSTYQRNVFGQLVHTDFQLNTNSCASCHMTHTAQARSLLFRNGVYSTCVACHDGTLGFLNVFAIPGESNPYGGSQTAGTFAANHARNASVHLATDTMKLAAAPGGNRANAAAGDNGAGTWNADFNCASCHGPHGSYSIRLLHYNPANIGMRPAILTGQEANSGGLWFQGAELKDSGGGKLKAYIGTTVVPRQDTPWLYSYAAGATMWNGRQPRFATRIWYDGFYNPNVTHGGPMSQFNGAAILNRFFSIKYGKGYAEQTPDQLAAMIAFLENPGLTGPLATGVTPIAPGSFDPANLRIDVGGVIVVTASTRNMVEIAALDPSEDNLALPEYSRNFIKTNTYSGKYGTAGANGLAGAAQGNQYAYNLYCAACHTDYLMGAASGQGATNGVGVYSKAYRHTINRGATVGGSMEVKGTGNALLCVSCHYVHGVDSSFQQLADGTLVDEAEFRQGTQAGDPNTFMGANDVNHSSALKRYINMAVCWTCHANSSAATLKNSSWYWDNYDIDGRGKW